MLDSVGRWLLRHFDYRVCGLLTLVLVMAFLGKRKWAQGGWPPILETLLAAASFLFILGGLLVMVVFLFTKPPAIDDLSPTTLSLIGIFVPIATGYLGWDKLHGAFFPSKPPPPESGEAQSDRNAP
jgi:hypothetical protein